MAEWVDAMFVRGGTSKGLFFTDAVLPLALPGGAESGTAVDPERLAARDRVLFAALGSPDPFGRQLNGMGGGASSLSKAMIVGRSARPGVDLDYTFAQVPVGADAQGRAEIDYSGNCGNLSSGVVPFALAAGLLSRPDGAQRFTLFNTNTGKQVDVRLTVEAGEARVAGEFAIPGVAGSGSCIDLVYPRPDGSRTGALLPSRRPADMLGAAAGGVRASLVDAAIPLVIVPAGEVGLSGAELPSELAARSETLALLDELRREGAVRMGLCDDPASAPLAVPKVVVVAPPAPSRLLDGSGLAASEIDVLARTISMGQPHGAVPGTGAMCLAAAAVVPGTVVAEAAGRTAAKGSLRIGTPSGVVTAGARVEPVRTGAPASATDGPAAELGEASPPPIAETSLARTARILMRGQVAVSV